MKKQSNNEAICIAVRTCQNLWKKWSAENDPQIRESLRVEQEKLYYLLRPYLRNWAKTGKFSGFSVVQDIRGQAEANRKLSYDASSESIDSRHGSENHDQDPHDRLEEIEKYLFGHIILNLANVPPLDPQKNPIALLKQLVGWRMQDEDKYETSKISETKTSKEQQADHEKVRYSLENSPLIILFSQLTQTFFDTGLPDPQGNQEVERFIERSDATIIIQEVWAYWQGKYASDRFFILEKIVHMRMNEVSSQ
jgi:hypothetical protein